jgi:hypothetical protein
MIMMLPVAGVLPAIEEAANISLPLAILIGATIGIGLAIALRQADRRVSLLVHGRSNRNESGSD